jgi:hypothetical protein
MIEFCCLAVFGFSFLRTHFWPFTDVLKENQPDITRKVVEAAVPAGFKEKAGDTLATTVDHADITDREQRTNRITPISF